MLASGGCDEPFSLVPFSLILSDFRYLFCRCIHFGAAAGCYLTIPVVADCYFVDDLYFGASALCTLESATDMINILDSAYLFLRWCRTLFY